MKITREQIAIALFNLVNINPPFVSASRKFIGWENYPPSQQPAILLTNNPKRADHADQSTAKGITKWQLHKLIWIYCQHSPDQGTVPESQLNLLVETVDDALRPLAGYQRQTLNGLVENCYIDGDIEQDPGWSPNDIQGVAVIPVRIVCIS